VSEKPPPADGGQAPAPSEGSAPRRGVPALVKTLVVPSLLVFVLIYLLSGISKVQPEQEALVTRFGKLQPLPLLPGIHYRLPYPVDRVTYIKPNEVKSVVVGKPLLLEEGESEDPYARGAGLGEEFLTGDENIVHIAVNVQYKLGEAADYLFGSVSPEELVRLATEAALSDVVARTHVDDLITAGKQWVLAQVKEKAQERLDQYEAGVLITSANFEKVAPPTEVSDAFKDVASALEDRDRLVNEANGEYGAAIPRARGDAERQKQEARGLKESGINRARGDADRFLAQLEEFRQSGRSETSRLRLYIETMEEVMPRMKKYVMDTSPPAP